MSRPAPALPVPTARAALLAALAAPFALLLAAVAPAAWIVAPVLGACLLLLVLADAFAAGALADAQVAARPEMEVGAEAELEIGAVFAGGRRSAVDGALALDPRLALGGRLAFAMEQMAGGAARAVLPVRPNRRGMGAVERLWLRWSGPLGLGARQSSLAVGQTVRVLPNVEQVRSPAFHLFLRDAQFGLIARRQRGEGTEFEALGEYRPGMDRRRIDWKSSARHVHLYARDHETERNNQIVFAFDCGRAMCEPVAGMPRIDRAVSAALAMSFVALKGGDKVALYGFAGRPAAFTPFISGSGAFHRVQQAAADMDYSPAEPNFTLALATLAGKLRRRSLNVVFSEFSDPTSAELMVESISRLVSRHLVVFVTMTDAELESFATAQPSGMQALATAVTAQSLLRQRALVLQRLRQIGVDVIEAPFAEIGPRLIDAYLAIKRAGAIG